MPLVFVRVAVEADLELIVSWWEDLARLHAAREGAFFQLAPDAVDLARRHFRELLGNPAALVVVAELEGAIAGFANAEIQARPPVFRPRSMLYVDNVYVREDARRKGIASALLARCREWGQDRGLELWSTKVCCWNEASLALCARAGLQARVFGLMGQLGEVVRPAEWAEPVD